MNTFGSPELERLTKGDREAFRELFDAFYVQMVQCAAFYVNDVAAAEDIVQETFTHVWLGRQKLRRVTNIRAYLVRWVKNDCLNHIKHQSVADRYLAKYMTGEVSMQDADPEPYVIAITNLIRQLPEKRRQVLELSIFESESYTAIAVRLNISVNTVKDHIKKAYAFLREQSDSIPYPP